MTKPADHIHLLCATFCRDLWRQDGPVDRVRHRQAFAKFVGLLAAGALVATPLAAQTVQPAQLQQEDVINLSAFEVSADAIRGYATTSAASASRIAVPITELPSSVIVINEAIIEDTMAVMASDTLNLIAGVATHTEMGASEKNSIAARGYTALGAQRDGFPDVLFGQFGGFSYSLVDRIEYVKGPSGILYGEHTPGGVLNLVSKRPLRNPRTRVGVMAGSFGFYRGEFDTSRRVGSEGRLGYRLAASYMLTEGPLRHPGQLYKDKGFTAINPVVSYTFANGLDVWAWTGFIRDKTNRLTRMTKTFALGGDGIAHPHPAIMRDGLAHNTVSSSTGVDTDNYELGATKRLEFGPVRLDARLLGRYSDQLDSGSLVTTIGSDVFVNRQGTIIGTDTRFTDFSAVRDDMYGFYRNGLQTTGTRTKTKTSTYAADFAFSFDIGPTRHKFLAFAMRNEVDRLATPGIDGRVYRITDAAILERLGAERVGNVGRVYLYPRERIFFAGVDPSVIVANANQIVVQNTTQTDSEQTAFGFMERMSFLNQRIFLVGGMRHTSENASVSINHAAPSLTTDRSWTSGYGILGKVYTGKHGEVALYYNANETFVPVFTLDQRLATFGRKFPNRTVEVNEFGAKFDLMDSRLVATASIFDMVENNVLVREVDVDGTVTGVVDRAYSVPAGRRTSEGWELDLAFNVMRGLDTIASYGRRSARLEDGLVPFGQPKATASVLARYQVQSGMLRGASAAWQYTWWGESTLNTRTNWLVPSGDLHSAVLGYRWKKMSFRLRIENVPNKLHLKPSSNETSVVVTNPRNYRFGVNYTF
jgi:outer membrane receptor protein involved in Fe transport